MAGAMRCVYSRPHGNGARGNCLQASLATLFGVDLDAVPSFECLPHWRLALAQWAAEQGRVWVQTPDPPAGELCLAVGLSPRGFRHCVVARDGLIVHDPSPVGGGLIRVTTYWVFEPD